MGRIDASTVTKQFKNTFDETELNELGKATRLCRREREATPYRLMLALLESFTSGRLDSIADIHRSFNALCRSQIRYKPFHNQLSKSGFAAFTHAVFTRVLSGLACEVLRFSPESPFARFEHIRIQDGTSFALHSSLADVFPGRFTATHPAAVELHVELDLLSEMPNRVVLAPDSASEPQFLPEPHEMASGLLLADRGYFAKGYLAALQRAAASFIVRSKTDINPLIVEAFGPDGCALEQFIGRRMREIKAKMAKYPCLDLTVRFDSDGAPLQCRLIVHPNARRDGVPRYLATNLERHRFTIEHVSTAYRLRWQIELLFKEWKSHANLRGFSTRNENIAEGLIWASLCAATVQRYCAHMAERIRRIAISTRIVAKSLHHVLHAILDDLLHDPAHLRASVAGALEYLATNARRAHPKRDRTSGRLRNELRHVHAPA